VEAARGERAENETRRAHAEWSYQVSGNILHGPLRAERLSAPLAIIEAVEHVRRTPTLDSDQRTDVIFVHNADASPDTLSVPTEHCPRTLSGGERLAAPVRRLEGLALRRGRRSPALATTELLEAATQTEDMVGATCLTRTRHRRSGASPERAETSRKRAPVVHSCLREIARSGLTIDTTYLGHIMVP
jgi:hypothetical protein